jgi:hypothetical protein
VPGRAVNNAIFHTSEVTLPTRYINSTIQQHSTFANRPRAVAAGAGWMNDDQPDKLSEGL